MSKEITFVEQQETTIVQLETTKEKYESIESDLTEIQHNLSNAAEKLATQLPTVMEFANSAQHPKVYEALAKMIVAFSTINRDAAAILKQKQDLYDSFRQKGGPDNKQTINDNRSINFHGTSTDLLDQVLNKRET